VYRYVIFVLGTTPIDILCMMLAVDQLHSSIWQNSGKNPSHHSFTSLKLSSVAN